MGLNFMEVSEAPKEVTVGKITQLTTNVPTAEEEVGQTRQSTVPTAVQVVDEGFVAKFDEFKAEIEHLVKSGRELEIKDQGTMQLAVGIAGK